MESRRAGLDAILLPTFGRFQRIMSSICQMASSTQWDKAMIEELAKGRAMEKILRG